MLQKKRRNGGHLDLPSLVIESYKGTLENAGDGFIYVPMEVGMDLPFVRDQTIRVGESNICYLKLSMKWDDLIERKSSLPFFHCALIFND